MKFHFDGHGLNNEEGKRILTFPDSLKHDGTAHKIAPDLCERLNDFDAIREALEDARSLILHNMPARERFDGTYNKICAALALRKDKSKIP